MKIIHSFRHVLVLLLLTLPMVGHSQSPSLLLKQQTNGLDLTVSSLSATGALFVFQATNLQSLEDNPVLFHQTNNASTNDVHLHVSPVGGFPKQGFFSASLWPGLSTEDFGDPENYPDEPPPAEVLVTAGIQYPIVSGQQVTVDFFIVDPLGQLLSVTQSVSVRVLRRSDGVIHPDAQLSPSTGEMVGGHLRLTMRINATTSLNGYTLGLGPSGVMLMNLTTFLKSTFNIQTNISVTTSNSLYQTLEDLRLLNTDPVADWSYPFVADGYPVAGTFGEWRGRGNTNVHKGVDLAAPANSIVVASRGGIVSRRGTLPGMGDYLVVDHGDGWFSRYLHLDPGLVVVDVGEAVTRGGFLATGLYAVGQWPVHLHFEVRRGLNQSRWNVAFPGVGQDPLQTAGIFSVPLGERPPELEEFGLTRRHPAQYAFVKSSPTADENDPIFLFARFLDKEPKSGGFRRLSLRSIGFLPEGTLAHNWIGPSNDTAIAELKPPLTGTPPATVNKGFARYGGTHAAVENPGNYFRYWWKWDTSIYTNAAIGPRHFALVGVDYGQAATNYSLTFGPQIVGNVVSNQGQWRFTNVAHLGTNFAGLSQPDYYKVQIIQSNGTVLTGVTWAAPITNAPQVGYTPGSNLHLQTNNYAFTLPSGANPVGLKLRISSVAVHDISHEVELVPSLIVMARTGLGGLTLINPNVAINQEGMIAFTGSDASGSAPFAVKDPLEIKSLGTIRGRTYSGVGISSGSDPQVLARELVPGPSYLVRSWNVATEEGVILGSSVASSGPQDFDSAASNVDFNSQAVAAVPALVGGSTATVLLIGDTRPLTQAAFYSGTLGLRPQIADTGEAVIRDNVGRIVTWTATGNSFVAASSAGGFGSDTGNKPGISRDGSAVAFSGNRGSGAGVYAVLRSPTFSPTVVPLVGGELGDGFSAFASEQRVGVRAVHNGSTNLVSVIFQASLNGVDGVYQRSLRVVDGILQPMSPPQAVIRMGDSFAGATVTGYTLYRPINDAGQLAFTIQLSDGSTVVVRRG